MSDQSVPPDPDLTGPPATDESGEVDLSLLEECLLLTPAQRIEQHYQARLFAEQLRRAGERYYGSLSPDPQTLE